MFVAANNSWAVIVWRTTNVKLKRKLAIYSIPIYTSHMSGEQHSITFDEEKHKNWEKNWLESRENETLRINKNYGLKYHLRFLLQKKSAVQAKSSLK